MTIYHIVALPEKSQRKLLNGLKDELYTWGYRYSLKPSSSDVHISLNQLVFDNPGIIPMIKTEIQKLAQKYEIFSLPYTEITEKIYKETDNEELKSKYPNGRGWVSLIFSNKNTSLWLLTKELITIAKILHIDDSNSYIERIKTVKPKHERTDDILDYTANHMNICNYSLPEKTKEAKLIVEKNIPKHIVFNTLALRNENWMLEFEVTLRS